MFTNFMEVFVTTHLVYLCVIPCFLSFGFLLIAILTDIGGLVTNNVGMYVIILLFMVISYGKVFDVMSEAPYFEARMEQFQFRDDKLKSLEY